MNVINSDHGKNYLLFFPHGATVPSGPGLPHYQGYTITLRHATHSLGIVWTGFQPDAENSTWQHTTLTRDRRPCLRRDSNPQSKQVRGRRPTHSTQRLLNNESYWLFISDNTITIWNNNNINNFYFFLIWTQGVFSTLLLSLAYPGILFGGVQ